MIKPTIDASDKELHYRNEFRHASKNLLQFIEADNRADYVTKEKLFQPSQLGSYSKDNRGVKKNVITMNNRADFSRKSYGLIGNPQYRFTGEAPKNMYTRLDRPPDIKTEEEIAAA